MPTYEYECKGCKEKIEIFQSINAEPVKKCPKCNGDLRRLISSGVGVIFKGSGFYATDYRKPGYKEKEKKEKSAPCQAAKPSCKGCPSAA